MQLSYPSSDPKELSKQTELFKSLKVQHDQTLRELTRGQNIASLEAQAKKALDDAKVEAAAIIQTAQRGKAQIEKSKCEYEALKAKIEDNKAITEKAKADALKAKTEADQAKIESEKIKADLAKELASVEKAKQALKAKAKELHDFTVRFSGSIN